jgi:signal transduction histidine kinase
VPAKARVRLVNEVPAELPIPSVDKDQLRQVLVNLVQNASEAMPEDREGRVTVRADGGGSSAWRILVEDDGAGIAKDALATIFEPLYTTKVKGTGLGLAIVSNIVGAHGGTIRVDSEVGKGSCFTIELPADAPARSEEMRAASAPPVAIAS